MRRTELGRRKAVGRLGALLCAAPLLASAAPRVAEARTATAPMEGRYALDVRVATVTRVPVMGRQNSITSTLLLVDVRRQGARWVQRQSVCDVAIESPRVRMTVPDAFIRSLVPREYTATLADAPGGARYTADFGVESIGFDPAVTGGALPKDARAPGVLDSDRDGEPGATVIGHFPVFGRVRLFVAQRTHLVLRGRQTAPGRIEGGMDILLLEQRTLGASSGLFRRTLETTPDPARSGFTMVRTGASSCEELRAAAPELLGSRKYAD